MAAWSQQKIGSTAAAWVVRAGLAAGLALPLVACGTAETAPTAATSDSQEAPDGSAADGQGQDGAQDAAPSDGAAADATDGADPEVLSDVGLAELPSDDGGANLDSAIDLDTAIELDTAIDPDSTGNPDGATIADAANSDAAADAVDAAADVSKVTCTPGVQSCEGPKLKSCLPKGDGYVLSNCFPGTTCSNGKCVAVANNLIIAFDTSGSMSEAVKVGGVNKCTSGYTTWPDCEYVKAEYATGCTRMGVSKYVFKQALSKIDESLVHMAMLRFPQKVSANISSSCTSGGYSGSSTISGDGGQQSIGPTDPPWFWTGLQEIMCVPFPKNKAETVKDAMTLWMDGLETKGPPANPELRPNGGTPIGKTLFYVGEYIRNMVVIDGKPCSDDASCGNVNYVCKDSVCVDPNRSCRETVVVLFTDGGEGNSNSFFAPWVQAKRLGTGLGCKTDGDCVGGATCQTFKSCTGVSGNLTKCLADSDCKSGSKCTDATQCMPTEEVTGWYCSKGMAPCLPDAQPGSPAHCAGGQCVQDPRMALTAKATKDQDNVLRSFDGKPFQVRVIVVDISGDVSASAVKGSASIAIAGAGKLLGADASDPQAMISTLNSAFDIKHKKVCGITQ